MGRRLPGDEAYGHQHGGADPRRTGPLDRRAIRVSAPKAEEVHYPPVDLVEMFLTLADKYDMAFYFGIYDSGKYWQEGLFQREIDLNRKLIDEVWAKYGHHQIVPGVVSVAGDQPSHEEHVAASTPSSAATPRRFPAG